ncbi:hypothetical protein Tsubulata_034580 [Turnera subulata]|uniref:Uncharacterized protein n=1 Tax=Turnera subulata TaxID=218843 RepID=A0A9Q0J4U6_9ROSI|nr:hypothetical protein Tsubulata_034580 [Turnera subulata]
MFYFKLVPLLLALTSIAISLSLNQVAAHIHHQPSLRTPGVIKNGKLNMFSRSALGLEHNTAELGGNHSLILAENRTHRKDPLDNFNYYKGGWNISDEHYFASVAYTAAPLFIIAMIWFLLYAVTLFIICIRHCCCKLNSFGYSRTLYTLSLILLIFFTIAVIIGSVVLYTGQGKFHSSTTGTLDYVVNQANSAADNLAIVSDYLSAAKGVGVDQFFLPATDLNNIDKVKNMINVSANILKKDTEKNSDTIRTVLQAIRVTLITVSAVMLFLALLGFLFSILGLQCFVHTLAAIGWILATISLLLCCSFLVLHNIVGDTCYAMDEWVQNPTALTALDDILPCLDNATAQATLAQSKATTSQIVGVVNFFITNVSNINPPPNLPPNLPPEIKKLYYNQSGPLVPVLCNPFNPDMTNRTCAAGEVNLSNAPQVKKKN